MSDLSERPPTAEEAQTASEALNSMAKAIADDRALPLLFERHGETARVSLPPAIAEIVFDLLNHIARGEMVTFVPYGAVLTTQKAADLLNVSRPFLIKLLEAGEIPFHHVGYHRRVRVDDLLAYKARRDQTRAGALTRLQRLGQEYEQG